MVIRHDDGRYGLDCWEKESDECEPATEFSDDLNALYQRAALIINAGRYKYLVLSEWRADLDDWLELDIFRPDQ